MRLRRLLAGAIAAGAGAATLLFLSGQGDWTPVDRPLPPLRGGGDMLRVVAFGTSLTAGGSWPDDLAIVLGDCLGRPVQVTRTAKAGAASDWGLSVVADVVAGDPDLVIMEFAINDADLRDGLWPGASRATHDAILDRLSVEAPGARVLLMTMNPAFGPRGWMRPKLASYYAALGPLADRHGAGLVDLYALWRALPDLRAALPDGLHPDPETASRVIVPAVASAIGRAAGRDCAVSPQP